MDLTSKIIEFENGEMSEDDVVVFFQALINSGMAWKLQGFYGRTAKALIEAGRCTMPAQKEVPRD